MICLWWGSCHKFWKCSFQLFDGLTWQNVWRSFPLPWQSRYIYFEIWNDCKTSLQNLLNAVFTLLVMSKCKWRKLDISRWNTLRLIPTLLLKNCMVDVISEVNGLWHLGFTSFDVRRGSSITHIKRMIGFTEFIHWVSYLRISHAQNAKSG